MRGKKFLFLTFPVVLLLMFFALQNTKPTCTPTEPEEPVCTENDTSACEGLPHIMCVGDWKCVSGKCVWECNMNDECYEEGEGFVLSPGDVVDGKCCDGLKPITDAVLNDDGSCSFPKCMCYVCTKCGDGICGKGENACNCPDDCEEGVSKCEEAGGTCKSTCGPTEDFSPIKCKNGESCCMPGKCDDGTDVTCKMMQPDCPEGTILAIQDHCWKCVDPDTCKEPEICGGIAGIKCAEGQVCDIEGCYPDASGICVPKPEVCIELYKPVCGCNGKTYSNDCFRLMAGVAKAYDGECKVDSCEESGGKCKSKCGITETESGKCENGDVCCMPGKCDDGTDPLCMIPIPEKCPYGTILAVQNNCWKCVLPDSCKAPKMCGGIGGFLCEDGFVCNIEACYPDASGVCIPKPEVCPKIYAPVCGCDGKTYSNDCMRVMAGASKDHDGECNEISECEKNGGKCLPWDPDYSSCKENGMDPSGYMCPSKSQVCCMPKKECKALDPSGYGSCEMLLGVVFDGKKCVYASGCSCEPDCEYFFNSMEECKKECLSSDECVIPPLYEPVTLKDLYENPENYDGKKVYVKGDVKMGPAICTMMACSPENPCCNACSAPLQLTDGTSTIPLDNGGIGTVGCSGNECDYMNNCTPFFPDPNYTVWGTVDVKYNGAHLMVDGYCK